MPGILPPIDETDREARHGDRRWHELAFVQLRTGAIAEAAMTLRSVTGAIDAIITYVMLVTELNGLLFFERKNERRIAALAAAGGLGGAGRESGYESCQHEDDQSAT